MTETHHATRYDLEARTYEFAHRVRVLVKRLPRTISNTEDGRQAVRSSGSVGANYIEANEALSKKDFIVRVKICRKEAKESAYWLRLMDLGEDGGLRQEQAALMREANELVSIFGAIVRKSEQPSRSKFEHLDVNT